MPEYTATLLLLFILVTCFYGKHITDWWWFKLGSCAFVASVVVVELGRISGGRVWTLPPLGSVLLHFFSSAGLILSGVAFVMACVRGRKQEGEHLRCLKCGYILKGLSQPRCPECGQAI